MKGLQLYTKQQQPWLQDQELMPTCQQQYRMIYQPEIIISQYQYHLPYGGKNTGSNLIIE
jgi:hypothetical protein